MRIFAMVWFSVLVVFYGYLSGEESQKPTACQITEWQKLYPKMASKMARMEEITNAIDRFIDDDSFKEQLLEYCMEFSWLAKKSTDHTLEYVDEDKSGAFNKLYLKRLT